MIQTAMQLKAKIRNMSGGDSTKVQILIRNYMMERFLERCAVSKSFYPERWNVCVLLCRFGYQSDHGY